MSQTTTETKVEATAKADEKKQQTQQMQQAGIAPSQIKIILKARGKERVASLRNITSVASHAASLKKELSEKTERRMALAASQRKQALQHAAATAAVARAKAFIRSKAGVNEWTRKQKIQQMKQAGLTASQIKIILKASGKERVANLKNVLSGRAASLKKELSEKTEKQMALAASQRKQALQRAAATAATARAKAFAQAKTADEQWTRKQKIQQMKKAGISASDIKSVLSKTGKHRAHLRLGGKHGEVSTSLLREAQKAVHKDAAKPAKKAKTFAKVRAKILHPLAWAKQQQEKQVEKEVAQKEQQKRAERKALVKRRIDEEAKEAADVPQSKG